MEHHTTDRPPASDPRRTQAAGDDIDEETRDLPHFRSLKVPGLMSGPILPKLMQLFRRKDARAARSLSANVV
jgi:hypothetical protein